MIGVGGNQSLIRDVELVMLGLAVGLEVGLNCAAVEGFQREPHLLGDDLGRAVEIVDGDRIDVESESETTESCPHWVTSDPNTNGLPVRVSIASPDSGQMRHGCNTGNDALHVPHTKRSPNRVSASTLWHFSHGPMPERSYQSAIASSSSMVA